MTSINKFAGYDFIQIGSTGSNPGAWASRTFTGKGAVLEPNRERRSKLNEAGVLARPETPVSLINYPSSVRFVFIEQYLQTVKSYQEFHDVVEAAYAAAREFIAIKAPNFDNETYLNNLGYKRYYADWTKHSFQHTTRHFSQTFNVLNLANWKIIESERVFDSNSSVIHPLESPKNQRVYSSAIHPSKPFKVFDKRLFTDLSAVIVKRAGINLDELVLKTMAPKAHSGSAKITDYRPSSAAAG